MPLRPSVLLQIVGFPHFYGQIIFIYIYIYIYIYDGLVSFLIIFMRCDYIAENVS